jgi:L-2-hydroxyglutarate oxidase LhgO
VAGLAVAKELSLSYTNIFVIEKNNGIGEEISSRNSEVIHAGIYYKKGSLKHRLITDGRDRLYQYIRERRIPYANCGKYVISSSSSETEKLNSIIENAQNCGVRDIIFDTKKFKKRYPFISVDEAIFSPSTGIIDSHQYMESLKDEFESNGGYVFLNNELSEIDCKNGIFVVLVNDKNKNSKFIIRTRVIVNCAGLYAPRIHNLACNQDDLFHQRYVKGDYYSYNGKESVDHLIYPIPEQDGLGVHLTMDLGGQLKFGPSTYEVDNIDYTINLDGKDDFIKSIRKYWPRIDINLLQPSYSGIRPKLVNVDDFQIIKKEFNGGVFLSVLGYESPGLTASLGLSKYVSRLLNE